jgi:hypothetical protein
MKSQDILPVAISVIVIILVAILEKQSKVIAAITATMPLTAALARWIVSTSQFSLSMIFGFIPTFFFMVAAWLAARAGWKLSGILLAGYGTWGIGVGILYALRSTLGIG